MDVYAIGTRVTIGDNIQGTVTAINIRGTSVTYEITWWNGMTRHCVFVESIEISVNKNELLTRMGFLA